MVFKKIIFQNRYVALETPSRPPPPFMANTILNFPFLLFEQLDAQQDNHPDNKEILQSNVLQSMLHVQQERKGEVTVFYCGNPGILFFSFGCCNAQTPIYDLFL